MANSLLEEGLPSVAPDATPPSDYQSVRPTAYQSMAQAGASAVKVADYFSQAASDQAFNNFEDGVNKILRGDPSKKVLGPNGEMIEDTGYLGLKGQVALDRRPDIEKQISDLYDQILDGLQTPDQEIRFQNAARRYRSSALVDVSSHADNAAQDWFGAVNAASSNNALTRIANSPLDADAVLSGTADLINARVKQATLAGAQPGDEVYNSTVATARSDAVKAQVLAIGASDPARALKVLEAKRTDAGLAYDELYNSLRSRADQEISIAAGTSAWETASGSVKTAETTSITNPAQPVYAQTVTAVPGGMTGGGLARTVAIESNGNPDAINASGHVGLGQFSPETWKEFGQGDPTDPEQSILAIQRYAASNAKYLTPILGRAPTDAELYIAHQQGPGGASKLLTNPNVPARLLIGMAAVTQNLPKSMQRYAATMTARDFLAYWTHKFNGTAPVQTEPTAEPEPASRAEFRSVSPSPTQVQAPAKDAPTSAPVLPSVPPSAKAQAYQAIMADDSLSPVQKEMAISQISQLAAAQQIADDQTASARKLASDTAANQYVTQMLNGKTEGLAQQIANDPNLEYSTKLALSNALISHADETASGAASAYGRDFYKVYQQVLAEPGDPSRIVDSTDLYRMAGPNGGLTLKGADKLAGLLTAVKKSPDQVGLEQAKQHLMDYGRSKISVDTSGQSAIPGVPVLRDAQGEMLFNSRFVPQFLSSYDQWVAAGKDPWDFLTQANVDKMAGTLRSPRELAMAKLAAMQSPTGDISGLGAPPAPEGVDANGWALIANTRTHTADGTARSPQAWTNAIGALLADPSADKIKQFDAYFAPDGITARTVFDILGIEPTEKEKPVVLGPQGGAMPPGVNPADYPGAHAVINGTEDVGLPLPEGQ